MVFKNDKNCLQKLHLSIANYTRVFSGGQLKIV